jgi:uncharacterized protein
MILAAVAALVGAAVQSATGFGFALVLSPALFAVMEPAEAVTVLLVLGVALNVLVLLEGHEARWSRLPPLILPALPGLALGAVVLAALSREPLQIGVGVAVIAAALWQLRDRGDAAARVPAAVAGFLSGVLTTSISISGPPLVLWLEAQALSPAEFRATLAAAFLALNLAGWAVLGVAGDASADLGELLVLLGVVVVGYVLGALAFRRLDHERFYRLVLVLVLVTGAASVVAGLA